MSKYFGITAYILILYQLGLNIQNVIMMRRDKKDEEAGKLTYYLTPCDAAAHKVNETKQAYTTS